MKMRLYVFFACLYVGLCSREPPWADAKVMYEATKSIVDKGSLQLTLEAPDFFFIIRDGKKYALNPPANIVAHIPGYLTYKALSSVPGAPREPLYRLGAHLPSALIMAGVLPLFFALARRQGASQRAALALTSMLGLGSVCVIYARVPFSEALQTLLLLWVVERSLALGERLTTRGAAWWGLASALLLHTKVVNLFPILVGGVYILVCQRRAGWPVLGRALAAAAASLVPLGVLLLAYNAARTGSPLDFGYREAAGEPVFAGQLYDGVFGLLFSPGRSVFLYSPILLLGVLAFPELARKHRGQAALLAGISLILFVPHAKFHDWSAGNGWGPRYMVPLTPILLLPAAGWLDGVLTRGNVRLRRAGVGAVAALGMFVQMLGCAFYWGAFIRIVSVVGGSLAYTVILFVPQLSQIVGHAWMLWNKLTGPGDVFPASAPWSRIAPTSQDAINIYTSTKIDWWFADPLIKGYGRPWAIAILVLLLVGLGWSAAGIWRRSRPMGHALGEATT